MIQFDIWELIMYGMLIAIIAYVCVLVVVLLINGAGDLSDKVKIPKEWKEEDEKWARMRNQR